MTKANCSKIHPLYLKASRGEHIATKDIATLIRDALKRNFPGTKFSVRSDSYSMGSSVDVRWQDGPNREQVDAIVMTYKVKGFDGSIDLAHTNNLWLYPDGSAHIAHGEGTEGSLGYVSEVIASPKNGSAILLQNLSHPYISTQRTMSPAAFHRAIAEYRAQNWVGAENVAWDKIEVVASDYDGSGYLKNCPTIQLHNHCRWLSDELHSLAYSYDLA